MLPVGRTLVGSFCVRSIVCSVFTVTVTITIQSVVLESDLVSKLGLKNNCQIMASRKAEKIKLHFS